MNPLVALLLGFTFSFAWTPCVGPTLASVLLMASSSATSGRGFLLVSVYTLGFVLPFLAVGLFTGSGAGFLPQKEKRGQIYGENRRRPADPDGYYDADRKHAI